MRGRVAENQRDWLRARQEFSQISAENPLFALATFHAAINSAELHDDPATERFLSLLPFDFPADLKLQLARKSGDALALKIYGSIASAANDQRDSTAKAKLAKLAPAADETLRSLTGQQVKGYPDWQKWWNDTGKKATKW